MKLWFNSQMRATVTLILVLIQYYSAWGYAQTLTAPPRPSTWIDRLFDIHSNAPVFFEHPTLLIKNHEHGELTLNQSMIGAPMKIGSQSFARGLGTHSGSHLSVFSPLPIVRFTAHIGIDNNKRTEGSRGSVLFHISEPQGELYQSELLTGASEPVKIDLTVNRSQYLDLIVADGGDGPSHDLADWADACIYLEDGSQIYLDELQRGDNRLKLETSPIPFSFYLNDAPSPAFLSQWRLERNTKPLDADRTEDILTWTAPDRTLKVKVEIINYADFPAREWTLYIENIGSQKSPIIRDIRCLDLNLSSSPYGQIPLLHRNNGAPADPTDFEHRTVELRPGAREVLGGRGGRSSYKDFPFFKLESAEGATIFAIGWSGQWHAEIGSDSAGQYFIWAGLETSHFSLLPGERVRLPRILILDWQGDPWEANSQFRQLFYKHYVPLRGGKKPLPTLYCNTCFTRGGTWLNETTAENQISLIRAFSNLGVEALVTDAGWFEGGWPEGAGNWTPRKDHYPEGMAPVAQAAKENNMIYGLWFEIERVVQGTQFDRQHPEWVLWAEGEDLTGAGSKPAGLANFALPQVRAYTIDNVKQFMQLPGFGVYRQDFNMNPLEYWRQNEAPDRKGILEIQYINGLYEYWDRLAETWPDSFRINCASGGRRIDIESMSRMNVTQTTDYWFDDDVNQAALWSLSQYLPNNVFDVPIEELDDYSFHSALASSLNLGWIADAPDFDMERARRLVEKYRAVRHLLIGGWYPLTPYSRTPDRWLAMQYYRPDLDEGLILAFRRAECPYPVIELKLHAVAPESMYELKSDRSGKTWQASGAELRNRMLLEMRERRQSDMITYRKLP